MPQKSTNRMDPPLTIHFPTINVELKHLTLVAFTCSEHFLYLHIVKVFLHKIMHNKCMIESVLGKYSDQLILFLVSRLVELLSETLMVLERIF